MDKLITIYLIRHGRQNSPLCNVDVPLSEEGILQGKFVGKRLKEYKVERVYSSNLLRAKMTANLIRGEILDENLLEQNILEKDLLENNFSKYEFVELRETDFGDLTGLGDEMIKEKYGYYLEARDSLREDLRIPGGENGEEVYLRMKYAIDKIIEEAKKEELNSIAVVTHGGAIRCFLAGLLNMPQSHRFMLVKNMENTSITEIRYNIDKDIFSVERINDYSHLEDYDVLLRKHFK